MENYNGLTEKSWTMTGHERNMQQIYNISSSCLGSEAYS